MNPCFHELPNRIRDWLKEQNETVGSLIFEEFQTVALGEGAPNPIGKGDVRATFPGLAVVAQTCRRINDQQHAGHQEKAFEHHIDVLVFRLLQRGEVPGLGVRRLGGLVFRLLSQHEDHMPVKSLVAPTDASKNLWRPEDTEATGFSLYFLTAEEASVVDPLPVSDGLLIEQSFVRIVARGLARHI
jgi:hypothetical protein